jgi:hypothetical protein
LETILAGLGDFAMPELYMILARLGNLCGIIEQSAEDKKSRERNLPAW